ncbi:MAG: hypothetical protein QOI04_1593 [Verrucomicrobiota bacterium]
MIHVNRGSTSLGIFSEEDVHAGLSSGRFAGTDLGWREGMASWLPLSQMPEFAAPGAPTGATPGATSTDPRSTITTSTMPARGRGLPWDERQTRGFFNAFIETLKMVLSTPSAAFTAMKREGGFGNPLIYSVTGGSIGLLFYFVYNFFFSSLGALGNRENPLTHAIGTGVGAILMIICVPLFVVIGAFLGSAILHVCLMIVGGAKQSFETTFRVVCFTGGSVGPIMIVPLCGGFIAGIWKLVLYCIGLSRAHETDIGRAVLAVLLPVIVCCGGAILLGIFFGGLGILSQLKH